MSRVISAPWIGTVLHTPYTLTSWIAVISLHTLFIKCTSAVPSMAHWVLHLSTNLFLHLSTWIINPITLSLVYMIFLEPSCLWLSGCLK